MRDHSNVFRPYESTSLGVTMSVTIEIPKEVYEILENEARRRGGTKFWT